MCCVVGLGIKEGTVCEGASALRKDPIQSWQRRFTLVGGAGVRQRFVGLDSVVALEVAPTPDLITRDSSKLNSRQVRLVKA